MIPLVAPPEIRGPLRKHAPKALKEQRREWMHEQSRNGYPVRMIAAALGITAKSANKHISPYRKGDFARSNPPHGSPWGTACRWSDFLPQQREALYIAAEKHGCENPGEIMTEIVRDWLAENAPSPQAAPGIDRAE